MTVPRKRRPQLRASNTRRKLLDESIRQFSEKGFESVSVRDIELGAGVQRNLLRYHFGSKEELWKEAVTSIAKKLATFTDARAEWIRDVSPSERIAVIIRSYVRFSQSAPEFNRIMIQEGKHRSWRLEWIVETIMGPALSDLEETVQAYLDIDAGEFINWYYMFAGAGALMFSMAPEAELLFGVDVHDEAVVARHTEMMVDFLLTRSKN
ncbi:MAG: TetR/AcrR family transcriptional regulator [Candidatus Micropelagos thuwalensis]